MRPRRRGYSIGWQMEILERHRIIVAGRLRQPVTPTSWGITIGTDNPPDGVEGEEFDGFRVVPKLDQLSVFEMEAAASRASLPCEVQG